MTDETEGRTQDDGPGSVLRRLISARNGARASAAVPALPQPVPATPARAVANAVSRAAEGLYGLAVKPLSVTPGGATQAELAELLPDPSLLAVLQGPGDAVGVVAMCPAMVTTLIEMQALGRVTARAVPKRRLTGSDAMLCADFVNALLAELQKELGGLEGFEGLAGFRYASHLDDARPLLLMMEDCGYRTISMNMDMGGRDHREGGFFLALPRPRTAALTAPPQASPADSPTSSKNGKDAPPLAEQPDLSAAIQVAPVELSGILCRRKVSLAQLRALQPGSMLSLPRTSLLEARVETRGGQLIAHGKLGEAEGCYAIRLHDPAMIKTAEAGPDDAAAPLSGLMMPSQDGLESPDELAGLDTPETDFAAPLSLDGLDMPEISGGLDGLDSPGGLDDPDGLDDLDAQEPPIEDLGGPDDFRLEDVLDQTAEGS